VLGTSKSAKVNTALVSIKVLALIMFIAVALPAAKDVNFAPFLPGGYPGVYAAAASIFFAYVGFDAVSTAAEETKNPQRNIPIGLIASLGVCTIFYLLVGYAATGSMGAQPMMGADGMPLATGSRELAAACAGSAALVCSSEPLAHVLRELGFAGLGNLIGIAAALALPSVILMMLFGQTRIFFTMARDGLLPEKLSSIHPKFHTPHVITIITGIAVSLFAGVFPVGILADISNSGTLFAFALVAVAVLILRRTQPNRPRPFRTPLPWIICPLAIAGCAFLFYSLSGHVPVAGMGPVRTQVFFVLWAVLGLVIYFLYGYRKSHMAPGNAARLAAAELEAAKLEPHPTFHEGPDPGP
ncbi:MAG: APC family permease, partial [Lysobacter sp.]